MLAIVGGINTAADIPHSKLSYALLHFDFKRNVSARSRGIQLPGDLNSPGRIALGAQHYAMVCANCHGEPGKGQSAVALSIRPRPQYLPKVIGEFTPQELFTIVQRGVAFSAMPSWPTQVRNDDIWTMVAFLRKLPGLDHKSYDRLVHDTVEPSPELTAPDMAQTNWVTRPSDTQRNIYPRQDYAYLTPAVGFSDGRLISDPVAVCSRCHGANGLGEPTHGEAPNLTIQSERYLEAALNAFATGKRKSGFMHKIAGQLTPDQIKALANHYASLPSKPTAVESSVDAHLRAEGQEIALNGVKDTGTPACALCHQRQVATPAKAPSIAGQSSTYSGANSWFCGAAEGAIRAFGIQCRALLIISPIPKSKRWRRTFQICHPRPRYHQKFPLLKCRPSPRLIYSHAARAAT